MFISNKFQACISPNTFGFIFYVGTLQHEIEKLSFTVLYDRQVNELVTQEPFQEGIMVIKFYKKNIKNQSKTSNRLSRYTKGIEHAGQRCT